MKIRWSADFGFACAEHHGTFEVEDDATDEEIDELVWEAACEYVSTGWERED